MTLVPGRRLGPYEILGPLGAGGMGEVWRARDSRLGRDVAIKVLPDEFAHDPARRSRFEREAKAIAALSHPNVLALHDFGADDGAIYAVMELLEGTTLRERLAGGPLSPRKAVDYAIQIAHGLAGAHERGIVHRDLKPENVLVTPDGRVKILDFGLARLDPYQSDGDTQTPTLAGATRPGAVLGTVGYMAPEQVRGETADARADIFSLGALLYEMLYGRRAFQRDTAAETMTAILREDPPPPPADTKVPPALDRVVRGCLEKAPGERFRSAHDLAFALEMALGSSTSQAAAVAAAKPRRGSRLLLAGGVAVLVLLVAGALLAGAARRSRPLFYRQLTSERGSVVSARFSPDGQTVVYGAAWVGHPLELFSTRTDGFESRSLELPSGDIQSISRTGDMLLLSGRRNLQSWMAVGTLARASFSGGGQRDILDGASAADLSPDGGKTAVVHRVGGMDQLECPPGTPLYRTLGWIGTPRFSPNGQRLAFIEHPLFGDDRGYLMVVDLGGGRPARLTDEYSSFQGLAWAGGGRELWFTATADSDAYFTLYATSGSRRTRVVLSAPVDLVIQDVSPRGVALLSANQSTGEIAGRFPGQESDRLVDFYAQSSTGGLSADGRTLAVTYAGAGSGFDYSVWIIRADGSPAEHVGEGAARAISPDGKWVVTTFASAPSRLELLSTGTEASRSFDLGGIAPTVNIGTPITWTRDGSAFLFTGRTAKSGTRSYLFRVAKGSARPVTPENTSDALLSPDGSEVLARDAAGFALWPLAGGEPRRVPALRDDDIPLQWEASGGSVFVWNGSFPAHVERLDLDTGRRSPWTTITPPDPSGVLYGNLLLTPDGKSYVYRYRRWLSNLFVVRGLH